MDGTNRSGWPAPPARGAGQGGTVIVEDKVRHTPSTSINPARAVRAPARATRAAHRQARAASRAVVKQLLEHSSALPLPCSLLLKALSSMPPLQPFSKTVPTLLSSPVFSTL